ncbi:hypothetical protein IFR05_010094 [Cadophora sp. M221]|nr:hypothetical protein IFR05_010094 [Cadophora sp. M221]
MCFGNKTNPSIPNGASHDMPIPICAIEKTHLDKDREQADPSLSVQWGWKGALASAPRLRSRAVQMSLDEKKKGEACDSRDIVGTPGGGFVTAVAGGYGKF